MKGAFLKSLDTFASVQNACGASAIKFLYNSKFKRIDVEFVDATKKLVLLKITFEVGPNGVDKDEYYCDLFGFKRKS